MINRKVIDLSSFRNGVTLFLKFKNVKQTFLVEITDPLNETVFYKRLFNKPNLELNLPVHSGFVNVKTYGGPELSSHIIDKIRIRKIPYKFNQELLQYRSYPVSAIRYQQCRNLPHNSEARFMYDTGIMQVDVDRMARLPQPVRMFIETHELGHYYYNDEEEADRFAIYQTHNLGYNMSNTMSALTDVLKTQSSDGSVHHLNIGRIVKAYNEIKKMHSQLS